MREVEVDGVATRQRKSTPTPIPTAWATFELLRITNSTLSEHTLSLAILHRKLPFQRFSAEIANKTALVKVFACNYRGKAGRGRKGCAYAGGWALESFMFADALVAHT